MENTRRFIAALLLVLACPVVAQEDESSAFFSISSDRTFAPSETPTVRLWGHGFEKLHFRLYRVNDPVAFFEKLQDDHQFGGEAPRQDAASLTLLERMRAWKRSWRNSARNLVRAQFTLDSRIQYRDWRMARDASGRSNRQFVQDYAQVPLLNPQQVVSTWEQPFSRENPWSSESIPVPVKGKGLYLVEATNGKIQAYTIVSVTDIAIVTKGMAGKLWSRVVRRDTGAPMKDCPVQLFGADRKKLGGGNTDANGLFLSPVENVRSDSLLVLARQGDDFAAVTMYGSAVSATDHDRTKGYVYTERPIYRPGHTVHYRAVLRTPRTLGFAIPSGEALVEVQDSDGKNIYRNKHMLSANGTLSGKFTLPASASLGYHSIEVRQGQGSSAGGFQVEEYRKPEYEVRVTSTVKRVVQGSAIPFTIDARYFYGEPVAGAKVTWVVHKERHWSWYRDDDEPADEGDGDSPWAHREQVSEDSGELNADGKLEISVPTAADKFDQRYRVEARVTDAAGREIAGTTFVLATIGDYWLRLSTDKYVYSPGDKARLTVEARDYDNKPVAGAAYTLEIFNYRGGNRVGNALSQFSGATGPDGTAAVTVPVESGWFRAVAQSRTPSGRVMEADDYLWVSGGMIDWSSGEQRIQIVPDKKSYKPGDIAKILVVAPAGSNLWITAEGRAIHQSRFVTSKESTVTVELPIQREFVPNFHFSAVALMKNQVLQGVKSVKVPPVEHTMQVSLTPAKQEYKPGEAGVYTLEARDAAGKPVSGEFSVGVVDEAVYAVRPDSTPDIASFFYGREYNWVNTETSMRYYFHGQAGKKRMQLAKIRPYHARAQLKPERLVTPKVRKAFPDTAFWSAEVRTDAAGRALVKLDFPDALTTWRATARGITPDTKVGGAVNKVIVRKNLLIRLSTPRFFRQGDTMTVSAIAQNYLTNEKQVRISLEAKGLEVVGLPTRDVTVPSKGTGVVDYRLRVQPGSEAVLLAKALTDEESDAIELTIPVIPFGTKMSDNRGGSFGGGTSQAEAELAFPPDAEPSSRAIEISAAPSVAGSLFDALDYLTAFPYGCTEQTMSSFLPNVIISHAVKTLGLKGRVDEADLAKKIRAGLDRLYDFQHEDGGWGWWQTDDSDVFMTSYVLAGLNQAKRAGRDVDSDRVERAAAWLKGAQIGNRPLDLQAYAAWALALNGAKDTTRLDTLHAKRGEMSPYGMALLGLAMSESGDKRGETVAKEFEAKAQTSDTEAWWKVDQDRMLDIFHDATPEATAFGMKLLARYNPGSSVLPKAALYLMTHRSEGYYWSSTKQTAMVILGLTDYLKQSGELKPDSTLSVFVNGKQVASRRFTPADALTPVTVTLKSDQLEAGANRVRVVRSGEGRAYWSAAAKYFSSTPKLQRGSQELKVQREYFRMAADNTGQKIVYDLRPVEGAVEQGDLLAVRLRVEGGSWRYLMVEDPIPSGAEIVARDDLYELRSKPSWWGYWFTRREYRDDRAVFFQTYLDRGSAEYTYLLKVVNPGAFRISPAKVEPMYQPRFFSTSDAARLEVKERAQEVRP